MDIDFIITAIVYLLVIIFFHMQLKTDPDINDLSDESKDRFDNVSYDNLVGKEKTIEDAYLPESYDNRSNDSKAGLIIDESELNNINNSSANEDFMKYLSVEESDNKNTHEQLVEPLQPATIDVTNNESTSNLDEYFANLKDDDFANLKDEKYVFKQVPTDSLESKPLYTKSELLNRTNNFDEISGFNECDDCYFNV